MVLTTTKVVVMQTTGADEIFVHTLFPSPCPGLSAEPLVLRFHAAQHTGATYVRRVFKIEPEIITV